MTGQTAPARLPWEPLERLLRSRLDAPSVDTWGLPGKGDPGLWSYTAAALMLDVHVRQVLRWRTDGLTPKAADTVAAWLSLHPLEIWGEDWEIAEDDHATQRQAKACVATRARRRKAVAAA